MGDKWKRPRSLGEIFNAVLDSTLRLLKVIPYGWDGSNAVAVKVDSGGVVATSMGMTTIADGRKVVASAGTREALVGSSTACKRVDIMAETDNTDYVVVGGSTVVAAVATRQGIPLAAGQTYTFHIDDLQDIYLDALVSGEGVTFTYFN
jgi:hypothetical protein